MHTWRKFGFAALYKSESGVVDAPAGIDRERRFPTLNEPKSVADELDGSHWERKRLLSEFVCDAVNMEGINFTLPEIQTLWKG